jgi:GntR family transcriptional regulator, transcriptional repressor for pyruvate dehydrogenase complex
MRPVGAAADPLPGARSPYGPYGSIVGQLVTWTDGIATWRIAARILSSQFSDCRSLSMKITVKPIKRDSVISQAAKEISRLIEQEKLAPGDKLPTESALSSMLGVSRNSVREALRVLHGLGYVEKAAGRRVVVTAASQSGRSIFDERVLLEAAPLANEVRSLVAQRCVELAAVRLTAAELSDLANALDAMEALIAEGDTSGAQRAHDAFYGGVLAGSRNPLMVALYNQAQIARLSNVAPQHTTFSDPKHLAHHRALLKALQQRDGQAAKTAVARHFQSLGVMLDFATHATKRRTSAVVPLTAKKR